MKKSMLRPLKDKKKVKDRKQLGVIRISVQAIALSSLQAVASQDGEVIIFFFSVRKPHILLC